MRSLANKNLDDIILTLSKKYGVNNAHLKSMINTVFRIFLTKMSGMNNTDIINMPGFGRFYMGQVAKRNKARWMFINELIRDELVKNNIKYEFI